MMSTRYDHVINAVWRHLPSLVLFSCLVNILLLVSVLYMLQVYDRVLSTASLDTLLWLTVGALAAIVIYGLIEHARRVELSRTGAWVQKELGSPVIQRAMEVRLSGAGGEAGPKDVADVRHFFDGDCLLAFLDAPWAFVFIAVIWLLHPALGMLATGGAVVLLLLAIGNDLATRTRQRRSAAALQANHEAAIRYIDGGETIGPLGMSESIIGRWNEREATAIEGQQRLSERTALIMGISRVVRLAMQILILGAGAFLVIEGELTGGGMIAGSIILARALAPVERSIGAWHRFVAARTAHLRLQNLFSNASRSQAPVKLPRPDGRLVVEGVNYVVPATLYPILTNISFALEPGQTCAIIGPSGSGKSSLCRLLVGTCRPYLGHVRLDGADVFSWDSQDLGQYVGYMPQQVELFPGSVAENICRFRQIDSDKLVDAAKLAGVHEMILGLPDGYQTDIGLHGRRISLGQRQRIALARALYDDPALLILDEPNSNLDSDGDIALTRTISEMKRRGRTIVIVTHRPVDLQTVDKILILRDGKVMRFGDRKDMLKPSGVAAPQVSEPAAAPGDKHLVRSERATPAE
jgi:ATP-binding cassette, subfamily C, type I secretion system permease/ATPase